MLLQDFNIVSYWSKAVKNFNRVAACADVDRGFKTGNEHVEIRIQNWESQRVVQERVHRTNIHSKQCRVSRTCYWEGIEGGQVTRVKQSRAYYFAMFFLADISVLA